MIWWGKYEVKEVILAGSFLVVWPVLPRIDGWRGALSAAVFELLVGGECAVAAFCEVDDGVRVIFAEGDVGSF